MLRGGGVGNNTQIYLALLQRIKWSKIKDGGVSRVFSEAGPIAKTRRRISRNPPEPVESLGCPNRGKLAAQV